MGLDCSHDAYHGAYSSFNRFRQAVAKAAGGSFPPHEKGWTDNGREPGENTWYVGDDYPQNEWAGLWAFLGHSDCDGEIDPEMCEKVANDLTKLLPAVAAMGEGEGHIKGNGGYGPVLKRFIDGCLEAFNANEELTFG